VRLNANGHPRCTPEAGRLVCQILPCTTCMLGDRNNKRRLENLCVSRIEFMHELLLYYRTQKLDSLFLNQKRRCCAVAGVMLPVYVASPDHSQMPASTSVKQTKAKRDRTPKQTLATQLSQFPRYVCRLDAQASRACSHLLCASLSDAAFRSRPAPLAQGDGGGKQRLVARPGVPPAGGGASAGVTRTVPPASVLRPMRSRPVPPR